MYIFNTSKLTYGYLSFFITRNNNFLLHHAFAMLFYDLVSLGVGTWYSIDILIV
jgi:hypothetical protein